MGLTTEPTSAAVQQQKQLALAQAYGTDAKAAETGLWKHDATPDMEKSAEDSIKNTENSLPQARLGGTWGTVCGDTLYDSKGGAIGLKDPGSGHWQSTQLPPPVNLILNGQEGTRHGNKLIDKQGHIIGKQDTTGKWVSTTEQPKYHETLDFLKTIHQQLQAQILSEQKEQSTARFGAHIRFDDSGNDSGGYLDESVTPLTGWLTGAGQQQDLYRKQQQAVETIMTDLQTGKITPAEARQRSVQLESKAVDESGRVLSNREMRADLATVATIALLVATPLPKPMEIPALAKAWETGKVLLSSSKLAEAGTNLIKLTSLIPIVKKFAPVLAETGNKIEPLIQKLAPVATKISDSAKKLGKTYWQSVTSQAAAYSYADSLRQKLTTGNINFRETIASTALGLLPTNLFVSETLGKLKPIAGVFKSLAALAEKSNLGKFVAEKALLTEETAINATLGTIASTSNGKVTRHDIKANVIDSLKTGHMAPHFEELLFARLLNTLFPHRVSAH